MKKEFYGSQDLKVQEQSYSGGFFLSRSQPHLSSSSCPKSTLVSKSTFPSFIILMGKELCSLLPHINSRKAPWLSVLGSYAPSQSRVAGLSSVQSKFPLYLGKERTMTIFYGGDTDCRGILQRNQKKGHSKTSWIHTNKMRLSQSGK